MKNILPILLFCCTGTSVGLGIYTKRFLSSAVCQDVATDCQSYGTATCTNILYKQWMSQYCAKTCNLCSVTSTGNAGTGNTGGGTAGSVSGCTFNGTIYHQGQTWKVDCNLKCHCVNDFSGQYTCNELCLRWKLPTQCHLQPPVIGKCCATPYCPEGFIVNYPPGYVPE